MSSPKLIFLFLIILSLLLLPSCTQTALNSSNSALSIEKEPEVRLAGTMGPLAIPLAYIAHENKLSEVAEKTTFTIWANPTQLQAVISGG